MATATMMTGATMRIRGMPAAIKAVISLCRWIHVTVNIAAISANRPLVRSKNKSGWKA